MPHILPERVLFIYPISGDISFYRELSFTFSLTGKYQPDRNILPRKRGSLFIILISRQVTGV